LTFNVLIQNTDDHLRNLGFLYVGARKWRLSPAFDVNPVPDQGTTLEKPRSSEIHGNALDVDNLIDAAPLFDVDTDDAVSVVSAMATTIKDEWRAIGVKVGMTSGGRQGHPAGDGKRADRPGAGARLSHGTRRWQFLMATLLRMVRCARQPAVPIIGMIHRHHR